MVRRAIHRAIAGVTEDLEAFHFNRSVARIHELVNVLSNIDPKTDGETLREGLEAVTLLIGPMMPHLAEELWHTLGHETPVAETDWPTFDKSLLIQDTVKIAVQVQGKCEALSKSPIMRKPVAEEAPALPTVIASLNGKNKEDYLRP